MTEVTISRSGTGRIAAGGDPLPQRVEAAIVGAGFAGIAVAVTLLRSGRSDFVVLERGNDVGGTWRDNSYPGCTCDVPSHLYSFSFAPNPSWSKSFSQQPEIQAYLQRTARDFGVLPKLRCNTEVSDAHWSEAEQRWTITTNRGTVIARFLIAATGPLSEPSIPAIPGLERFQGTVFHSAAWRHDHDLRGRRVASVGTGASAIQFVPHVQRQAAHLTVFQRTAPWVMPRRDRRISRAEQRLYRALPLLQRALRAGIYAGRECWLMGFHHPSVMRVGERLALRHLRSQVPDAELRRKLTPNFRLGCKRVLLSNDWYPALQKPNVEVVTDRIVEITETGVISQAADGSRREHTVDTIILGTGFHVTDPPIADRVRDDAGRSLADHWREKGMEALHGLCVAGFPNLFFLVGPNTGLGHTSVVVMIEAQVAHVAKLLDALDRSSSGAVEPRADVQDAYNRRVQRDLQGTVWNAGGCSSWYLDANGRNTTIWPGFTFNFIKELHRADLSEYQLRPRVSEPVGADA